MFTIQLTSNAHSKEELLGVNLDHLYVVLEWNVKLKIIFVRENYTQQIYSLEPEMRCMKVIENS